MIDIIIPFQRVDLYRLKNLKYCVEYYRKNLKSLNKIVVVEENTKSVTYNNIDIHHYVSGNGEFNKTKMFGIGFSITNESHLMLTDADCLIPKSTLKYIDETYAEITKNKAIIPYSKPVINLTLEQSEKIYNGDKFPTNEVELIRRKWNTNGGVLLISREMYLKVGGHDPRFVGWGGEDDAFYMKMYKLDLIEFIIGDLYHLFHPSQSQIGGVINSKYYDNVKYLSEYTTEEDILNLIEKLGRKHLLK